MSGGTREPYSIYSKINEIYRNSNVDGDRSSEVTNNVDKALHELIVKLLVDKRTLRDKVSQQSESLMNSVPHVLLEAKSMENEYSGLKKSFQSLYNELSHLDEDTIGAVKQLQHVDKIKTRMNNCANILHEIENWNHRIERIRISFSSRNYLSISTEISKMIAGVDLIQMIPQHEQRLAELEQFQDTLESMTRNDLLKTLESHDSENLHEFFDIYENIGRTSFISTQYVHIVGEKVRQLFADMPFISAKSLDILYKQSLEYLMAELLWMKNISKFRDFNGFYESIFDTYLVQMRMNISTWLSNSINTECENEDEDIFSISFHLLDVTSLFHQELLSFWDSFFVSINENCESTLITSKYIHQQIYQPYHVIIDQYDEICTSHLLSSLKSINIDIDEYSQSIDQAFKNCLKQMSRTHSIVLKTLEETFNLSIRFSQGLSSISLIDSLNVFINEYVKKIFKLLKNLRKLTGLNSSSTIGSQSTEWSRIEMCFALQKEYSQFIGNLQGVEHNIDNALVESIRTLLSSSCVFDFLPSYPRDMQKLEEFISEKDQLNIFSSSKVSLESLTESCFNFAFDGLMLPVRLCFKDYESLHQWSESKSAKKPILPSFSLSPTEPITKVGDELFSLAQELEIHSPPDDSESLHSLMTWLNRIGSGTCKLFLQKLVKISYISVKGCSQLIADIEYLISIFESLGISIYEDNELFISCKTLLSMEIDDIKSMQFTNSEIHDAAQIIIRMRQGRPIKS